MGSESVIVIDGQEFFFSPGETILQVAQRNGFDIPTLCYLKGASPTGACRMCLVEVEGAQSLVASCATHAAPNMVIRTENSRVINARRTNLEVLLASGHHNCLVQDLGIDSWTDFQLKSMAAKGHEDLCPAYGECRLQDLAVRYQVKANHFAPAEVRYPIEDVNPFIVRDFSRCILCGRCVQACNEVQVNNAISFDYRGSKSKIVTEGDRPLKDSNCVFCGECVQACPVGALIPKEDLLFERSSTETRKIRTTCSYCGVGCQLYLHVRNNKVIKVTGVKDVGPNFGSLCVKGSFEYGFIHDPGRLKTPLIRENGTFREASWEEALNLVSENLKRIKKDAGPDAIGVVSSACLTNEENYLVQKFARAVIGTNNVDYRASIFQNPTLAGLTAALGSGAMTNPIEDLEKADVSLITGSDITETHPVLSAYVKRAVSFKGGKLIVVDPREIKISGFATLFLKPKPGTDITWINGIMHVIIKENLYDESYVTSRTVGLDELKKAVEKYTPEHVEEITGIPCTDLIAAARLYAEAEAGSIIYAKGITHQNSGEDIVKSLANLAMLCGNVGIRGGGLNPLCLQSNAQGACDMGVLPDVYSGYQKVADQAVVDRMAKFWSVENLPQHPGFTATEMMDKAQRGEMKALYVIGQNPVVSEIDFDYEQKCLEKLDFLVVQDIVMTETAKMANVILPSTSFAEKDGTFTNTERRVQRVRKAVVPPGEAREDREIICDLANRMGYSMAYENSQAVMEEITKVTPSYGGINYERINNEGLYSPCTGVDHPGTSRLHKEKFACGRGVFHAII